MGPSVQQLLHFHHLPDEQTSTWLSSVQGTVFGRGSLPEKPKFWGPGWKAESLDQLWEKPDALRKVLETICSRKLFSEVGHPRGLGRESWYQETGEKLGRCCLCK